MPVLLSVLIARVCPALLQFVIEREQGVCGESSETDEVEVSRSGSDPMWRLTYWLVFQSKFGKVPQVQRSVRRLQVCFVPIPVSSSALRFVPRV